MKNSANKFIVLQEVESTNNYANRLLLSDKAEHGSVVLAQYQKEGKGQAGKQWESEAGMNLLASIILHPEFLQPDKQFYLSKITSLALVDLLSSETEQVTIKWPNDIYVKNRKIAGILIENSIKGNYLNSSVLGIGLNLNQEKFFSDAPNPVSLKQITAKNYKVEEMAELLVFYIFRWYEKLKMNSLNEVDVRYFSKLYRKNEWAKYQKNNQLFEARITGVGEFGQLILEDRTGTITTNMFKEIEFVI